MSLDLDIGANGGDANRVIDQITTGLDQLIRTLQRLDSMTSTARVDADTTPAEEALDEVASHAEDAGSEAGEKFGAGLAAGVVAIGAAGAKLGEALMGSLEEAMDRENATAKLQVQLGTTKDVAAQFGKLAGDLYANNFGDSMETVNDALVKVHQNIGESFTDSDDVLKDVTGTVLSLSSAFDVDVAGSTKAVGALLKNGLAPDAKSALDIITVGFQQGVDKSEDFLDTLNEYSPQFAKFGLDGATSVGLLRQGLQGGARDADLVADAIKEFSIRAIDGSDSTADGFKKLGLSAEDMATRIGKGGSSASGALDETLDKLRGIPDPVKRASVATELFGTQAEDLGNALFSLDPSKAVEGLGDVAGAAGRMNDALGDTASSRIETLKRTIETGLVNMIGGQLLPIFDKVAQFGSSIFGEAWGPVTDILGFLAGTGGVVAGVLLAITGATWAWTTASAALSATWLANPITWVVVGIVALVATIIYAYNHFETFRTIVDAVWAGIKVAFTVAWDVIKAVFSFIVEAAIAVGTAFADAWNGIGKFITDLWDGVTGFLTAVWNGIVAVAVTIFTAYVDFWVGLWNGIVTVITSVWDGIVSFVTGVWNGIVTIAQTVWGAITDYFTRLFYAHYDLIMGVWNAITGFLNAVWGGIVAAAMAIWTPVSDFFTWLWTTVSTGATVTWNAITAFLQAAWAAIVAFFTPALQAFAAGWQLMLDTLSAAWQAVWGAVTSVATAAWNATVSFFTGAWNNFVAGWQAFINLLSAAWTVVWNAISAFGQSVWNGIVAFFTPAWNTFKAAWSAVWDAVVKSFQTVWGTISSIAQSVWDGVKNVFKTGVNGVIDVINWLTSKVNVVLKFLLIPEIPAVPTMAGGGTIGGVAIPAFAAGGHMGINFGPTGHGFKTNGPRAIVGEGNQAYPEYVIPTDPKYRKNAMGLLAQLHGDIGMMEGGGWLGDAASWAWNGITGAANSVGSAIGNAVSWVGDAAADTLNTLKQAIAGMLPSGFFGQMGKGVTDKVITAAQAMISKKYAEQQAAAAAAGGGTAVASGPVWDVIQRTAAQFGWGSGAEWAALQWIISHESGGNPNAQNPTSTAYGLFQFLNGTWASTGIAKTSDPALQALAGMRYIGSRYRDPVGAQAFWQAHGWYANGGLITSPTYGVVGESGPELILPLTRPRRAGQLLDQAGIGAAGEGMSTSGIEEKLDRLTDTIERRGAGASFVINDTSGNPAETARTTVLALQLL